MKVLVTGDSFATLDPKQSHWATIWGEQNNFKVEHKAFPGQSHVNIVTTVLNTTNFSDYGLVIYHVTDYLRAQIDLTDAGFNNILNNILGFYSDVNFTKAEKLNILDRSKVLTDFVYDPVNISPNNLDPEFIQDKDCKDKTLNLYNSINLYWLMQANYNSMRLLQNTCKINGVPIILVIEPDMSKFVDTEFYSEDTLIFMTNIELDQDSNTTGWEEDSTNHLSKSCHNQISGVFNNFIINNNILKQ